MLAPEEPEVVCESIRRKPIFGRLSLGDAVCISTAIVSLLTACVLASSRKPFWNDEINVWVPATDPSLRHMLWAASHACSGGTSPLYFVLLRGWMFVAGQSVFSVRLFSCIAFCAALSTLWVVLRRHLRFQAVTFALLTVWCTSTVIFQQLVEGRGYGLYVFAAVLGISAFDSIAVVEDCSKGQLVAVAFASGALVSAHYFGILYSGLMLVALLIWDRMNGRFRPKPYAAMVAGWLVLLPRLGAMGHDAALLKERSYFGTPTPADLERVFTFGVSYLPIFAFLVILAVAITLLPSHCRNELPEPAQRSAQPLMILAVAWILLPLLLFVVFHFVPRPVFLDRYLLPSVVGFAIVLAIAAEKMLIGANVPSRLILRTAGERMLLLSGVLLFGAVAIVPVQQSHVRQYSASIAPKLAQLTPAGVPVVIAWQWEFMQANFYSRQQPPRYYYVLDRDVAMDPESAIDEPLFYNERTAWKNAGYWADRTLESSEFLCRYDRFAVLDAPGRLWFSRRVLHNPAFAVESKTVLDGRYFAVIHRVPGATLPNCRANH